MRKLWIVLLISIPFLIWASEIKVVFLDYRSDIPVAKVFEFKGNPLEAIFSHLYDPPPNLRSFVPRGCLRAAYILDDAVVLDLYSSKLKGMSFYAERMMLYQILLSVFLSLDVERVYIIKDGKPADVLSRYVDISLSFGREEWTEWPVR